MRIVATLSVAALLSCGDVTNLVVVLEDRDASADAPTGTGVVSPDAALDAGDGASEGGGGSGDAAPDAPAAVDPVFGTSTYAANSPGTPANMVPEHPAAELPLQGKNCFKAGGCHAENNTKFGFAGTVYGGGTYAEVRVVDEVGAQVGFAYADGDGNFWSFGPKPPTNGRVGVRNGGATKNMVATVTGADGAACSSGACHGSTSLRIYLP